MADFNSNMTAQEILNMSYDQLSSLDTKQMSRALRTASLAANKRIARLRKESKLTKTGYVSKEGGKGIAPFALNWVTMNGRKKFKFGVKKASSRNKMLEQLTTIKKFWNMQTSSVTKSVEFRKEHERKLFGKTREEAAKGKSKKRREEIYAEYSQKIRDVYEVYHKFLEFKELDPKSQYDNSKRLLQLIANKIEFEDQDVETALNSVIEFAQELYEEKISSNPIANTSPFSL